MESEIKNTIPFTVVEKKKKLSYKPNKIYTGTYVLEITNSEKNI